MDIHAPEKPIHSLKDFATHIAVVTVGILIALGLEGIREHFHDRHLAQETRDSFREEMEHDLRYMSFELPAVQKGYEQLQELNAELPALAEQHPEQVIAKLQRVKNPYFFFSENSWQAALSTGALAHMKPDEVAMYAWSAGGTRIYTGLQQATERSQAKAESFWLSHPHPNADQIGVGMELLQEYMFDQRWLTHVGPQTKSGYEKALRTAETN